jgi:hypothetical protein
LIATLTASNDEIALKDQSEERDVSPRNAP